MHARAKIRLLLNYIHPVRRLVLLIFAAISYVSLSSFVPAGDTQIVNEILKHTNQSRRANGLSPLALNENLNNIARKHSADMALGQRSFGHDGFEQRQVQVARIMNYRSIAENVASGATSAQQVVSMWMNSPGHRRNILGNFRYIGIGIARDHRGQIYYTQLFVR